MLRKTHTLEKQDTDGVIDPVGLRLTLRKAFERYNLPILITENGIGAPDELTDEATVEDDYRIDYIRESFKASTIGTY